MPSLEERVACLEGRMEDHMGAFGDLRADIAEVRGEIGDLRKQMDRWFDALEQKLDRHFTWLVGIQVAVLVAVAGALVGSYYK